MKSAFTLALRQDQGLALNIAPHFSYGPASEVQKQGLRILYSKS